MRFLGRTMIFNSYKGDELKILTQGEGESIQIGRDIQISLRKIGRRYIRIGIQTPEGMKIQQMQTIYELELNSEDFNRSVFFPVMKERRHECEVSEKNQEGQERFTKIKSDVNELVNLYERWERSKDPREIQKNWSKIRNLSLEIQRSMN